MEPNPVEALAASESMYEVLRKIAVDPLVLNMPIDSWLMVWPLASVHRTVHPMIGASDSTGRAASRVLLPHFGDRR